MVGVPSILDSSITNLASFSLLHTPLHTSIAAAYIIGLRRDHRPDPFVIMPPRTPSRRNGAGHRSSQFEDDLPIYGIPSSPANPTSGSIGPNGGIRPGSGLVPGSASRKSNENQNHNLNHLLGLRMPPRVVVGSGMGSGVSAGSASAVPRRSRGIKNSFNKESKSAGDRSGSGTGL